MRPTCRDAAGARAGEGAGGRARRPREGGGDAWEKRKNYSGSGTM
jgi:hypothetical protein